MQPTTIGRYRIIAKLGEGGMGTVYEAEQDHPHRRVALKVIRPGLMMSEIARRFERESDVLGRLQHPGIAQIYEAGTAAGPGGPLSFFAMELIRGESLTDYAAGRSLGTPQRLELFAKICDAVHYAHRQGVIHRDLKPANIMVDGDGNPKILDFGVARLTDADVQATRQTSVGEVIGTLQYMSPEQVNADPAEIDVRSDVYSLGVILFELLSGRLPYDLGRKLIYEAARVILVDDPSRLSSVDRRFAGDIEIIVAKALEKERDRRYATADDVASDIRRFLRDEPIVARPASALYQLGKFARRNRALVGGLALAAATLMVGTVVSVWQAVRATAAERIAETRHREALASRQLAERRRSQADSALVVADSARAAAQREQVAATASARRAQDEAAKAQAVSDFLQNVLASPNPANARGKDLTVRELLDQAAGKTAAPELRRQPEVRAAVNGAIGRSYFGLGMYPEAGPHFDSAYAIHRRVGATGLGLAQSADELGKLAQAKGEYPKAERLLREALAGFRASVPGDDDRVTSALEALADSRYQQGNFPEAERLYREALRLAQARHGKAAEPVALRLMGLGKFLSYTARPAEALPLLEDAVGIFRRLYGSNHPQVVEALVGVSDAQAHLQKYAAAEATLRETLPIALTIYGREHPTVADVVGRLTGALRNQRRFEEAEPYGRDALAMRIKLLGGQHPDVQLARTELGRISAEMGRFAQAESLLTQALESRRAVLGDQSPAVASSYTDLGWMAALKGDWARSASGYGASIPIWEAAKIEDQALFAKGGLARALQQQGQLDQAEKLLVEVLARRKVLYGESHWSVGDADEKLSSVVFARGRVAEAESLAFVGLAIRKLAYGPKSPQTAGQLLNVAFFAEARGDSAGAVKPIRESLEIATASRPPTDPSVITPLRLLAIDLCATGRAAEGDSLIRVAIDRVGADTTQPLGDRLRSVLGFCLTRRGRYPEAEPVLLRAEGRLGAFAAAAQPHQLAVAWLVSLYQAWGKPEQAALWRQRSAGRP